LMMHEMLTMHMPLDVGDSYPAKPSTTSPSTTTATWP
jgi:hypothetical protein